MSQLTPFATGSPNLVRYSVLCQEEGSVLCHKREVCSAKVCSASQTVCFVRKGKCALSGSVLCQEGEVCSARKCPLSG